MWCLLVMQSTRLFTSVSFSKWHLAELLDENEEIRSPVNFPWEKLTPFQRLILVRCAVSKQRYSTCFEHFIVNLNHSNLKFSKQNLWVLQVTFMLEGRTHTLIGWHSWSPSVSAHSPPEEEDLESRYMRGMKVSGCSAPSPRPFRGPPPTDSTPALCSPRHPQSRHRPGLWGLRIGKHIHPPAVNYGDMLPDSSCFTITGVGGLGMQMGVIHEPLKTSKA